MDRQSRGSAAVNGQIELSQPTAGEAVGDHLQQLARQEARQMFTAGCCRSACKPWLVCL